MSYLDKRVSLFGSSLDPLAQRRKFLTTIALGASTVALAACGGGGDAANPGAVADASTDKRQRRAASAASAASTASSASTANAATTVVTDTSFGVKGDGTTNDRVALQNAIDGSIGKILLITGASRIDAAGLDLRTNSHVRFAANASIKLLPHNTATYQILRMFDVQNVTLESPNLDGSKELNSATPNANSGGGGMAISIAGSTNINITSPTTINTWGDGIYIANSYHTPANISSGITVVNHHATGCRRQGATIISGQNVTFQTPLWENIAGTMPSAGLDLEPNSNLDVLEGINIVSPVTRNCHFGILIFLGNLPGAQSKNVTVTITNHTDYSANDAAFYVTGLELNGHTVTGLIQSQSPTYNQSVTGFRNDDWDKAGPGVEVTNITTNK